MWSVWLVFSDCVFHFVCPLRDKDKKLVEASWWKRLTEGKTGSSLMGGAMLSKSLIQFSVDGQGCVPSLLFDQIEVEVKKTMATSFKRSPAHCPTQCPDPVAGHCQPTPPLETPGHTQASLGPSLVGSLLPSPGSWCAQGFVGALQESVSPVLCNQNPKIKIL